MSDKPAPGTKAAREAGCRCTRIKGSWGDWDWSFCNLHAPPMPLIGPGFCEHGEREWECGECRDREQMNAAYAGVNWYRHHVGQLRTVAAETRRPWEAA